MAVYILKFVKGLRCKGAKELKQYPSTIAPYSPSPLNQKAQVNFGFIIAVLLLIVVIITATRAAIGISWSNGLQSNIIANKLIPEENVDSLVLPPFSTFITDCPTSAHPAIPPNKEETILAMP